MSLYSLKLNQTQVIEKSRTGIPDYAIAIRRVPPGWIYEYYNVDVKDIDACVFVPFVPETNANVRRGESFMYKLGPNEAARLKGHGIDADVFITVRSVPSGWLYEYYSELDFLVKQVVFIPLVDVDQKLDKPDEKPKLPNRRRPAPRLPTAPNRSPKRSVVKKDIGMVSVKGATYE